ncbi:RdgB/HAM1 family non-canonical purine NTP pyrophosphatase [Psittacicella hinzii]|uniref:dITP/XTP pyrophosphatase n=1 Tax=Psittacicella hinzii TaxID=2028575 RepID=A0A3A1YMV9_9GAMM|nr:RdgB/HAM1 family non-canonical purine NTP pyrophosphatase [Psittacicella hinzii]RIY38578.1 non-canonical purine NTP pyrophosphatase, RdgB/HAM1 family [Psittacicella hinzii]
MVKQILLATSNQGKLKEFQDLFNHADLGTAVQIRSLAEFPQVDSPEENAPSFIGNALIKAYHGAALTGLPTLADDSGICVDALQSAPGIYSARFAQMQNFTPEDPSINKEQLNFLSLLETLAKVPEGQRQAHFYCCLVLVRFPNDPEPLVAVGTCEGYILFNAVGTNGHGYDPIFFSPELNLSFAQATMAQKNSVSHRHRAFADLIQRGLKEFLAK